MQLTHRGSCWAHEQSKAGEMEALADSRVAAGAQNIAALSQPRHIRATA